MNTSVFADVVKSCWTYIDNPSRDNRIYETYRAHCYKQGKQRMEGVKNKVKFCIGSFLRIHLSGITLNSSRFFFFFSIALLFLHASLSMTRGHAFKSRSVAEGMRWYTLYIFWIF